LLPGITMARLVSPEIERAISTLFLAVPLPRSPANSIMS
jgi:hypothetical protein